MNQLPFRGQAYPQISNLEFTITSDKKVEDALELQALLNQTPYPQAHFYDQTFDGREYHYMFKL